MEMMIQYQKVYHHWKRPKYVTSLVIILNYSDVYHSDDAFGTPIYHQAAIWIIVLNLRQSFLNRSI